MSDNKPQKKKNSLSLLFSSLFGAKKKLSILEEAQLGLL